VAKPALLAPARMARVRQIQVRTRGAVQGALQGAYRSRFRGAGLEFEEVRPYQPGDEVRTIDWNVTARTGEPHVKSYIEDRQLVLQVIVDTSASMNFGTAERSKREVAAELTALLAFAAAGQHDQVGLTLFSDVPGEHLAPDTGPAHVQRLVHEVFFPQPKPRARQTRGEATGLAAVCEHTLKHLKRRAIVFVIGDFLDAERGDWTDALSKLSQRHDVMCLRVYDALEERLPNAGIMLLEGMESEFGQGDPVEVDTSSARVREIWASRAAARRGSLVDCTRRAQVDLVEVRTDEDPADALVAAFRRRAMRGGLA
jgi:uncharacterized protein (DUF58 family)